MEEPLERAMEARNAAYYKVAERVITLASTLLAVTITFRNSLLSAEHGQIRCPRLLVLAWVGLAVAVAAGLLALFGDVQARTQAVVKLASRIFPAGGKPGRFFTFSYYLMALAFFIALAAFVAFAILNSPH